MRLMLLYYKICPCLLVRGLHGDYRMFQKNRNPLSFEFLQEIAEFELICDIPPENTIYLFSTDIQAGWIN